MLEIPWGDIIKGYESLPDGVKGYIPNYEYLVYDVSRYTDDEIKGSVYLRIMLTLLKDIFTKDDEDGGEVYTVKKTAYLSRRNK